MTEKNETEQEYGKILYHPGVQVYWTQCAACGKKGQFEAYRIYEDSLANAIFYCNDCKHYHPEGYNIDIKHCPELQGKNAIPKGVIIWEKKH